MLSVKLESHSCCALHSSHRRGRREADCCSESQLPNFEVFMEYVADTTFLSEID